MRPSLKRGVRRKGLETVDGKRNMKLSPSVFDSLIAVKGNRTWDDTFLHLIKRNEELTKIEQQAMNELME